MPTKSLVHAYDEAGDIVRKTANISFEIVPWGDENWNPCGDQDVKVPFNFKQKHPNNWSSGDHYYLLRLADIILLKAEAQNALGHVADAAITLNLIRSRAHLNPTTAASQDQMKTAILSEASA